MKYAVRLAPVAQRDLVRLMVFLVGKSPAAVPFGDSGYAIWFALRDDHVIVARIFHMREDR